MWILSGYYYPSAIPAKFGSRRVRVKHSNILNVICTYCKYINASMENATCIFFIIFFGVNLPLFCKVDKVSIIFFCNWMLYIGLMSTKFSKNLKEKSSKSLFERIFPASTRCPGDVP